MADNFHGYGEWHYADGTVYKGQWIKGWMHGKGTMYYLNGTRRTGEWQNGDFKGKIDNLIYRSSTIMFWF